ncbi:hypothetical protein QCA50_016106 [Cerrena zonata]|uniref:GPI ethanolamine phosphate transferase 1 n=1 Tax=Cerrena zonata TaxID=2478898 RepID=A0AAW0FGE6_9APHY
MTLPPPRPKEGGILHLLLLGLVFHLVYIGTVFDCYFTSPVVNGMQRHGLGHGPAKRLVLIVADGLRADLVLSRKPFPMIPNSPDIVAPYLREVMEKKGGFGVSHTRVPTESRPGHVALIGGMYEDVSAVTKGWKTNPVDFDSVFNRSSHTYSFGSPDILPMFAQGATDGKVDMWSYHEDEEDFTRDATALDTWVLDQLQTLFRNASTDVTLNKQIRNDKTVFFLHLLGLDTTGHSYRPFSKEYMNNIQVVDDIVRQTESLFSSFYNDSETAFVFTADHGMSKIGNHGDGDPDSTRTPLIVWGKGVRGPTPDTIPSSHDDYSIPWDLMHLLRRDVEQADVAALMAALVGVDWPVNSVGVLPDVDHRRPGYLVDADGGKTKAELALVNAKVVLEHYRVKHENKKQHALFYKPYSYFAREPDSVPGQSDTAQIEDLISQRQYDDAREAASRLIKNSLEGLRYLETYDRTLIGAIVVAAYLGWIVYGASAILIPSTNAVAAKRGNIVDILAVSLLVIFWTLFAVQKAKFTLYLYVVFPIYFWRQALNRSIGQLSTLFSGISYVDLIVKGIVVITTLEGMVLAYTHRSIWSVGFVVMGLVWPSVFWPKEVRSQHLQLLGAWSLTCLGTAIFPLLDVNKQESVPTLLAGGVCMLVGGLGGAKIVILQLEQSQRSMFRKIIILQIGLLLASMIVTVSSVSNLSQKRGLPILNQIAGWILLVIASALPFVLRLSKPTPESRILTFFLGFSVCFVILSISSEGLFYFSYSFTLFIWTEVETVLRAQKHRIQLKQDDNKAETGLAATMEEYRPQMDDLRIAVFFLFFVQVGFFGTGNVASISSFYLEPVYRLVPIFSPFLMAALLIFKIVAPYIILSSVFALLNARLHLPPFSLFLVALTLTDVMTMTFFFKVTDTGSWLEIGQTISFFCVSSLLLVWSAGICAIGEVLMSNTTMHRLSKVKQS